jgi:hypothetical protein
MSRIGAAAPAAGRAIRPPVTRSARSVQESLLAVRDHGDVATWLASVGDAIRRASGRGLTRW